MTIDFDKLAAPFKDDELEWLPKIVKKDGTAALALVYVTARAIMNRLDDVVGQANWQDHYEIIGTNVKCRLEIRVGGEWIGKEDAADMTDIEAIKGGFSGALKRAAVKWGMGRYLYNADNTWFKCKAEEYGGKMQFKHWTETPRLTIDGKPVNAVKVQDDEPEPARNEPPAKPKGQATSATITPSVFAADRSPIAPEKLTDLILIHSKEIADNNPAWKRKLNKDEGEDQRLAIELSGLGWADDDRHSFLEETFGVGSYSALLVSQGVALKTWVKSNIATAREEFEGWREYTAFNTLGKAS